MHSAVIAVVTQYNCRSYTFQINVHWCILVEVVDVFAFNVGRDFIRLLFFCSIASKWFNKLEVLHGCLLHSMLETTVEQFLLTMLLHTLYFFLLVGFAMSIAFKNDNAKYDWGRCMLQFGLKVAIRFRHRASSRPLFKLILFSMTRRTCAQDSELLCHGIFISMIVLWQFYLKLLAHHLHPKDASASLFCKSKDHLALLKLLFLNTTRRRVSLPSPTLRR